MTHRNLTSSSLNDISDKPEKDQVSKEFLPVLKTKIERACRGAENGSAVLFASLSMMCR